MNRRVVTIAKIKVIFLTILFFVSTNVKPHERSDRRQEKRGALTNVVSSALSSMAEVLGNSLIAFSSGDQVFIMNSDGSNLRRLTEDTPGVYNRYPALSPDGKRVAFIQDKGLGEYTLCVIGIDGKGLEYLASSLIVLGEPAWSPDGSQIAFIKGYDPTTNGFANLTGCNTEICVINLASGEIVNLTQGAGGTDPAWAPDGSRLAFSTVRDGNYEIYTMAVDGSQVKRLTNTSWAEAEPAWAPDGSRIAYVSHLIQANNDCGFMPTGGLGGGSTNEERSSVFFMNVDGANQTRLEGTYGTLEVAWSPSGTKLALALKLKSSTQIYVTDIWGSQPTKLTSDATQKSSPSWAQQQTISR